MINDEDKTNPTNTLMEYCLKYNVDFEKGQYSLVATQILNKIVGRRKYYMTSNSWCSDINDKESNETVFNFDQFDNYRVALIQFIKKVEFLYKLEILEK